MSLNDPRWGRDAGEDPDRKTQDPDDNERRDRTDDERRSDDRRGERGRNDRNDRNDEGDELDELWRNFTDTLNQALGRGRASERRDPHSRLKSRDDFSRDDEEDDRFEDPSGPRVRPEPAPGRERARSPFEAFARRTRAARGPRGPQDARRSSIGLGAIALCVVAGWAATGFYIVPEGQTGVVQTFGRYAESTMPGFHWRVPSPFQNMQLVDVSSVRTAEIGSASSPNRLSEALMLTDDENIVDVQFTVQYRIKPETGARDYLFNTRAPDVSVVQAAESAMREVVGRKTMDSILFESKAEIAEAVKVSMQAMLDRYATGIEVMSVAIQNAQPPQPVQAAFNDAVKAGQDRERSINLGEAYMNAVIPKAQGTASRLKEEAEGYKARVVETAAGDADRFKSVYEEYRRAPEVTRDRLYLDAMGEVFARVPKVYVDAASSNNLLYLPLDKLVERTQSAARSEAASAVPLDEPASAPAAPSGTSSTRNDAAAVYTTEPNVDTRDFVRNRIRQ